MPGSTFSTVTAQTYTATGTPTLDQHLVPKAFVEAITNPLGAASHAAVTTLNLNKSVIIGLSGQVISAEVNLLASFADGQGQINKTGAGKLYVVIGTTSSTVAAGNHGHIAATSSVDGFMAAADKAKLDGIAEGATNLSLGGSGSADTASHSDHSHTAVTSSDDGFMTSAMLADLNNALAGAAGGWKPKGVWNASTNTPTIDPASDANSFWYYRVSVAGDTEIDGISDWNVGDWIVSDGTAWLKLDNTDQVSSVAGKTGAITLVIADISDATAVGKNIVKLATPAAAAYLQVDETGAATLLEVDEFIASLGDFAATSLKNGAGDVFFEFNDGLDMWTPNPDVRIGSVDGSSYFDSTGFYGNLVQTSEARVGGLSVGGGLNFVGATADGTLEDSGVNKTDPVFTTVGTATGFGFAADGSLAWLLTGSPGDTVKVAADNRGVVGTGFAADDLRSLADLRNMAAGIPISDGSGTYLLAVPGTDYLRPDGSAADLTDIAAERLIDSEDIFGMFGGIPGWGPTNSDIRIQSNDGSTWFGNDGMHLDGTHLFFGDNLQFMGPDGGVTGLREIKLPNRSGIVLLEDGSAAGLSDIPNIFDQTLNSADTPSFGSVTATAEGFIGPGGGLTDVVSTHLDDAGQTFGIIASSPTQWGPNDGSARITSQNGLHGVGNDGFFGSGTDLQVPRLTNPDVTDQLAWVFGNGWGPLLLDSPFYSLDGGTYFDNSGFHGTHHGDGSDLDGIFPTVSNVIAGNGTGGCSDTGIDPAGLLFFTGGVIAGNTVKVGAGGIGLEDTGFNASDLAALADLVTVGSSGGMIPVGDGTGTFTGAVPNVDYANAFSSVEGNILASNAADGAQIDDSGLLVADVAEAVYYNAMNLNLLTAITGGAGLIKTSGGGFGIAISGTDFLAAFAGTYQNLPMVDADGSLVDSGIASAAVGDAIGTMTTITTLPAGYIYSDGGGGLSADNNRLMANTPSFGVNGDDGDNSIGLDSDADIITALTTFTAAWPTAAAIVKALASSYKNTMYQLSQGAIPF